MNSHIAFPPPCSTPATDVHIISTSDNAVVERLRLPDGRVVVRKRTRTAPFGQEPDALRAAHDCGADVPEVYAIGRHAGHTCFLMEDLGAAHRTATMHDVAHAAAALHRAGVHAVHGDVLDAGALLDLPHRGLAALDHLTLTTGQAQNLVDLLRTIQAHAARYTGDDPAHAPFGLCHGQLHPSAVHVTATRTALIDWAFTFTGPGLLDLAAYFGCRTLIDPHAMRGLIHAYIDAGGSPSAAACRGTLPAERWALSWHRIHSAIWNLEHDVSLGAAQRQLHDAMTYWE